MPKDHNAGKILIDRRRFLKGAGFLAAGSFCGCSLAGCAPEVYISIPCLGPAAAPSSVPGMTYIKASEIGCALDCDLQSGRNKYHGGDATDDGPLINAAMAAATATNPITFIIDGSALISGLFLPPAGNWAIAGLGCGTGFFVKTGTNNDGIHNGPSGALIPNTPGPPAPSRGSNVSLSNFTLNANAGNGTNGDSTSGIPQVSGTTQIYGINLLSLNNIVLNRVVVVNAPAYHVHLGNVGNVTATGCVMKSTGVNTDGMHFDGPANDVDISNCDFTTGDDAIAFNCPEGYSGNISRVSVTNCTFNSTSLMRLDTIEYSGSPDAFTIDTVTVSKCSGTFTYTGFFIGDGSGSLPNSVTGLTISDCSITAPVVLDVGAGFGSVILNNVSFIPFTFFNSLQDPGFSFVHTGKFLADCSYIGSSLTLNNCSIQHNGGAKVFGLILQNNSSIANLTFNGFAMVDAGSPGAELLNFVAGSIGQLVLTSLNSASIQAPVESGGFTNIGSVSGAGVLATGWQFPDSVMANGVPYISASTGQSSIKVNGVVEPYG